MEERLLLGGHLQHIFSGSRKCAFFFGECVKPSKHGFVPLFIEKPAVTSYQCGCGINIVTLQEVKIFISNFVQALPGIGD